MTAGFGTRILILRHGPAEGLSGEHARDADRRLTPEGRELTRRACRVLAGMLPAFERVYTSPYVRARETAELLAAALSLPGPETTPLLAPGFDRVALAGLLARGDGGPVVVVGHEPDLSALVAWLSGAWVLMDKGTACLTELARPGTAQLLGLYHQADLAALDGIDEFD